MGGGIKRKYFGKRWVFFWHLKLLMLLTSIIYLEDYARVLGAAFLKGLLPVPHHFCWCFHINNII